MATRQRTDMKLRDERLKKDFEVLRFCLDNLSSLATGGLESPAKLMVFYAGYTAMRSIWEIKTDHGKTIPNDADVRDHLKKDDPDGLVFRTNTEVSHSIGRPSKPLLRVTTFRFWAKKILKLWDTA